MLELIIILSSVLRKYSDLAVVSALLVVNAVLSSTKKTGARKHPAQPERMPTGRVKSKLSLRQGNPPQREREDAETLISGAAGMTSRKSWGRSPSRP